MAKSDRELLKLGSTELNDGEAFEILGDSFSFTPAQLKPIFAENPSADGDAVVGLEQHYSNCYFEFDLAVAAPPSQAVAYERLANAISALQRCQDVVGGHPLVWTPNGQETAYTAYVLLAEILEIPMTVSGDGAGWFEGFPMIRVKLTCRSFLYRPTRTAKAETTAPAEPIHAFYVAGVGGDVPAEAELLFTEPGTADRRHVEFGLEQVASESNPSLLIKAASLVISEFSGSSTTRSGAFSEEKVKRATAVSLPTPMCGTGKIAHVGSYRVKVRVWCSSVDVLVRMSWRDGYGLLQGEAWNELPLTSVWCEVDLGEVNFTEAELGTQGSEIRFEILTRGTPTAIDINYVELIPTGRGYGKIQGLAHDDSGALKGYDEFGHAAGNLEGKVMPLGGTWAMANKTGAEGWQASGSYARRSKVSDSAVTNGSYGLAGSTEYTGATVSALFESANSNWGYGEMRLGIFARYVDANNWIGTFFGHGVFGTIYIFTIKKVAGVETILAENALWSFYGGPLPLMQLTLAITPEGTWTAYVNSPSVAVENIRGGQDPVLATGGALAKGKVGIYDAWKSALAKERNADLFSVIASEPADKAIYKSQQGFVRTGGYLREDSSGTYDGPASTYYGPDLYIPNEGEAETVSRIATKIRRNDVDSEEDSPVTDTNKVEVKVRERFLLPR